MSSLERMLWPRSIAVIGASADTRTIRGRILEYLLQRKYSGQLFLVSATQTEIRGLRAYRSITDLPAAVDLVLIAARASATPQILQECAKAGAGFAICYSSGFAEEGAEGAQLQRQIADVAVSTGLRICGPNTAGFYNVAAEIPATFARNVDATRAVDSVHRRGAPTVSIVAQSGGLAFAMHDRCVQEHGLMVSSVVSTGNEVDLEVLDFVEAAIDDRNTRVILLLVEGLKHAHRLENVARHALLRAKPIVVAKFGNTGAGKRAVSSHAARLTGSDSAYDAAFRRHGLIRVEDEDSMADLAAAFSLYAPPAGRRVGILTTSGGAGVWMADACESIGLTVPVLDAATQKTLATWVPSYGAIHNPVDLTAQVTVNPDGVGSTQSALVGAIRALLNCRTLDCVVLVANLSDGQLLSRERAGLAALAAGLSKPLLVYSHAPACRASQELVQEIGLVCLASTRRVAQVISNMVRYAECRAAVAEPQHIAPPPTAVTEPDRTALARGMCEFEAKALLGRYGIPITREILARTADEAVAAAVALDAAVALKIQSRQIAHKTELNGVILAVQGEARVRQAFATLIEGARAAVPGAEIEGVLVQEMMPAGHELALGIVTDADFGPMLMIGVGGIHIEVMKDVIVEPLPVGREEALRMMRRLRGWPLLEGARGRPPADVEALAETAAKLSSLALGAGGACREIDLNPVFVYERGAVVIDAVIVGRDEVAAGSLGDTA